MVKVLHVTNSMMFTGTRPPSRFLSMLRTSVPKQPHLRLPCHHVGSVTSTHMSGAVMCLLLTMDCKCSDTKEPIISASSGHKADGK